MHAFNALQSLEGDYCRSKQIKAFLQVVASVASAATVNSKYLLSNSKKSAVNLLEEFCKSSKGATSDFTLLKEELFVLTKIKKIPPSRDLVREEVAYCYPS